MSKFSQESTDAVLQMMRWEVDSCFPLPLPPMSSVELEHTRKVKHHEPIWQMLISPEPKTHFVRLGNGG
jgi:hypothetical protein